MPCKLPSWENLIAITLAAAVLTIEPVAAQQPIGPPSNEGNVLTVSPTSPSNVDDLQSPYARYTKFRRLGGALLGIGLATFAVGTITMYATYSDDPYATPYDPCTDRTVYEEDDWCFNIEWPRDTWYPPALRSVGFAVLALPFVGVGTAFLGIGTRKRNRLELRASIGLSRLSFEVAF